MEPDEIAGQQQPKSLELTLAQQANEAIKAGHDPAEVTKMLGRVVQHLRSHPDVNQQASEALAAGHDPVAIAGILGQMATDPASKWHEAFRTGHLPAAVQAANAADPDVTEGQDADPLGEAVRSVGSGVATTLSGLPGGKLAAAGARKVLTGDSFDDSRKAVNESVEEYARENPRSAMALQVAGSLPLLGPLGRLGAAAGGGLAGNAAIGAAAAGAQRALDTTDESLADRAKGTVGAAALGGGLGIVAPWATRNPIVRTGLGALAGGVLAPSGAVPTTIGALTGGAIAAKPGGVLSLASKAADKLGASKASTMLDALAQTAGTRGDVNREMSGIQQLTEPLGGNVGEGGNAAQRKIAAAQAFNQKAKALYERARTDNRILDDPDVQNLISDPHLQKFWHQTVGIRDAEGVPVPTAMGTMGVVDIPDPEALHLMKRLARDVVDKGYNQNTTISLADAKLLEPKLQQLTQILHDRSPDWKFADRFFQAGKTLEEGANIGYGATKPGMQNPTAKNLGTADPVGAASFVQNQPSRRLQVLAGRGVQEGAKGQMLQQLQKAGIDEGREGVLNSPVLGNSGPAQQQRALALGAQAPDYTRMTGDVAKQVADEKSFLQSILSHARGETGMIARAADRFTNPMASGTAKKMLSEIVADPQAYQQVLGQYRSGLPLRQALDRFTAMQAGETAGKP